MSQSTNWVVTTSGSRPVEELADEMTAAGFVVDQILREIGCITGSAGSLDVVRRVRKLAGVADVAPAPVVDIGPPDAPVTW